jgi:O-succinylbenzoate synthase
MDAKEYLEQFSGEWLEHNKDIMCKFMEQYATLKVMLELENIKKDIKALSKINASPLCCDDIDEQIKQLRGLQLKMLKK